ncbi:MAG: hypothetical protein H0X37_05365 [Herpetosiphonaceae bacterium]|nr:hypothetical protein [Herpetosiphonaceae bacterium]
MTLPIIITAIILNGLLLLGLIILLPRLLQRSDSRAADEALRLREMLLDVLSEQEAVTIRQNQIGTALAQVNRDVTRIADNDKPGLSPEALAQAAGFPHLERRLEALQGQIGTWFDERAAVQRTTQVAEAQSWGNLMGLLATMQDRIAILNNAVAQKGQPPVSLASEQLLADLENEMQQLRGLADEIAGLQWKLRRSVLERENNLAALRSKMVGLPPYNHRAA